MAMQQGIVSTTIGAEGIQHTDGKNILLADQPEDFAQKVLVLLDDARYRHDVAEAGRQLVCDHYDWNIIGKQLKIIYQGVSRV